MVKKRELKSASAVMSKAVRETFKIAGSAKASHFRHIL